MCVPGLEEVRASLDTTVLGPAQTSMHIAASLGTRFSVLDGLAEGREHVEQQIRRYGLLRSYASHRALGIPVFDLYKDPERTLASLEREAHAAIKNDGAGILLLGCTGLAELADTLSYRLNSKGARYLVLEPLRTTVGVARTLIDATLSSRWQAPEVS
jgi:allantoin racemase